MKKIINLLLCCLLSVSAYAVMASPEPFPYTLPDGTTIMVRQYGDEFHSYITTLDGELLEGSMDAEVIEQAARIRRKAHAPQAAGNTNFPTIGSPHSLVLLVGFSDLDFAQSQKDFQDLLTKSGYNYSGATGSCRDYYIASSDSLFSPLFDCYGPYKLSRKVEYYGENSGDNHNKHAADMVAEACQLAHEAGVNFKDYDTNNDGQLDNVFIFFAGHNEAEGGGANTIWPHAGNISYRNIVLDGVLVTSYACTSEYKGSAGVARCGVGTFCHEFGHVIGQPDFYDTDYKLYTVGNWDVMCQGSYNNNGNTPPTFSAYERMYEGWLTPKQLILPGQYTLTDIPFHKEAYLIAAQTHNLSGLHPNPSEFFLLDYRSEANVWDSALPGHGMLVWHIDYLASAWTNNTPNNGPTLLRMHLEEANGIGWKKRSQGENGRDSDPYPGALNITTFTPTLHSGEQLPQPVFNITENGGVVNFIYISSGGTTLKTDKEELNLITTIGDKKEVVDWEPQSFVLLGTGLDPNEPVLLSSNESTFYLFAGDSAPERKSSDWQNSLPLYAHADSTLQQTVWVNFSPTKKRCTPVSTSLNISATTASISLALTGSAPRPTYVTTPTTLESRDITPYSFTARWKTVNDAERYYVTLYQLETGETNFTQSFEDFDDISKIHKQGWESNTTLTTTSAKADGSRSLYIKNHGDQITSETYPSAISSISFWMNAFTASVDTIGVLEIEAYNGNEWILTEHFIVTNKVKRQTEVRLFEDSLAYTAFRFTWVDNGGAGIAFDYFVATTSQKINYIYRGTELSILPAEEKTISYTINDLNPANTYYYQVQCSDLDKGCEEHLTDLSNPVQVATLDGEPLDGKRLTLVYDSINYNPATRTLYLTNPEEGDYLYFYSPDGKVVYSLPVEKDVYSYPLKAQYFMARRTYLVQHAKNGKLGRKNKWIKFVF